MSGTGRMVPGTRYIDTPAKQASGGAATVYIHIDAVVAIREVDDSSCRVLLSGITDWLQVDMAAMDVINEIKAAP